jgi:putative ABC transport system permease protein
VTVNYTPDDEGEEVLMDNYIDFTVVGILNTGGSEEEYVYFSTEDMETLTNITDDVDLVELSIIGGSESLSSYAETISSEVPAISARLVKRVTASETTVLSKLQALIFLVTIVVLALTMICVATTMSAVVEERRKEIGLRKAIGASDGSIIKEFMGEGVMLGLAGGILGSILGFIFAQTVAVNVFSGSITFRPLLVPITIIVSIAVTALASMSPIKSATSVDPALVLKGE